MKDKHTYHDSEASGLLPDALRVNPYTVPAGYFEEMQRYILQRCNVIKASEDAFDVPPGYFEQLEQRILANVKEQKLKSAVSEAGFIAPEGYFNKLEEQSFNLYKLQEKTDSPGFTVPGNYFDALRERTLRRALAVPATSRKLAPARWVAYAAAACIALAVGITGLLRFAGQDQAITREPLALVSDQDIINYLELYGTTSDITYISEHLEDFGERNIGEGLNEEDIEAYLNNTL